MQQITYITVDVGRVDSLPSIIPAKQGDTGRYIHATVNDKGVSFDMTGATAIARIHKPDGTNCLYDEGVTVEGNTVVIPLVDQALTAHGRARGEINLYTSDADRITTFEFWIDIEASTVADGEIVSSDYYNALTQTAAQILATNTMVKPVGFYDSLSDLMDAVPSPAIGDMYGVGTAAPYDYYVWSGEAWINNGQIGANDIPYLGTATGTDTAMVLDYSGAIGNGQPFVFSPSINGKAGATLKVGDGEAYPILNHDGTPVDDHMLYANVPIVAIFRAASSTATAAYVVTLDGTSGEAGATFIPALSAEGELSWSNDKGLENPAPVNIRGPQGIQGIQGETGPYFTPDVSADGTLSWSNNGGLENPEPINIKGDTGPTGPAGPNRITADTETDLNGVLIGEEGNVTAYTPTEVRIALDIPARGFEYGGRAIPYSWAEIQAKIRAADFTGLRVGDYKDITLNGSFYDAAADADKTMSSAVFRMEIAGIDSYYRYGDVFVPHHIDFISRDCYATALLYNATATNSGGFIGSALFTTLNGDRGIVSLLPSDVKAVVIEKQALCETKTEADASAWAWGSFGKLWLPTEFEVWGGRIFAEQRACGLAAHYPIFGDGSLRHIIKGAGNGGSRCHWWCASSVAGSAATFCIVNTSGYPSTASATNAGVRVPLCFRIA